MQKIFPKDTAKILHDCLLATEDLDGYYKIDYYTGEITVHGVYLPSGLCCCSKYNQVTNDYEYTDEEWINFSEYTQRMILLEVGDLIRFSQHFKRMSQN